MRFIEYDIKCMRESDGCPPPECQTCLPAGRAHPGGVLKIVTPSGDVPPSGYSGGVQLGHPGGGQYSVLFYKEIKGDSMICSRD